MKKKLLSFVAAVAFILMAGLCLTACGGEEDTSNRCYFTIKVPAHCEYQVYNGGTGIDKNGRQYSNKGSSIEFGFRVADGWESATGLTLAINGEPVDWTYDDGNGQYILNYTPTTDYDIVVSSGEITEKICRVNFVREDMGGIKSLNDIYIRFPEDNGAGKALAEFLASDDANQTLAYGETVEFWIYAQQYCLYDEYGKGYYPTVSGYYADRYQSGSEYGWHVKFQATGNDTIYLGVREVEVSFSAKMSRKQGTDEYEHSYPDPDGELHGGSSSFYLFNNDCYDYVIRAEVANGTLRITLCEDVPAEVIAGLTITINGVEHKLAAFTASNTNNNDREYTLRLEESDKYNSEYIYKYVFGINVHEFEYFQACYM